MEQQRAEWASNVPASVLGFDGSLTITIKPGIVSGWMVWSGNNKEPDGYFTSLPEAWEFATLLAIEMGKPRGELPFRPQQPMQILPPQPQPQAYTQPIQQPQQPPPTPSYREPMPSFIEKETLTDKIASVQRNGSRAASLAVAGFMGALMLAQLGRALGIA